MTKVLSPRQRQVSDMEAAGFSRAEIAMELKLSKETVRNVSAAARRKLNGGSGELTSMERAVLALLAFGFGDEETARLLHLTGKTIESHVLHIYEKSGAKNRFQLISFALTGSPLAAARKLQAGAVQDELQSIKDPTRPPRGDRRFRQDWAPAGSAALVADAAAS